MNASNQVRPNGFLAGVQVIPGTYIWGGFDAMRYVLLNIMNHQNKVQDQCQQASGFVPGSGAGTWFRRL
jgi:hypothetical protein